MKALVLESKNRLVYKDVPDPQINPDEVLTSLMAPVGLAHHGNVLACVQGEMVFD